MERLNSPTREDWKKTSNELELLRLEMQGRLKREEKERQGRTDEKDRQERMEEKHRQER